MSPNSRLICAPHLTAPHRHTSPIADATRSRRSPLDLALRLCFSPGLAYPQDRLTNKIASHQLGSCRADRAPIRIDRYQGAKPPVGQQLEQPAKPLARPLDLDIAREIEPFGAAVASQHEVADREICLLTSAYAVKNSTTVVVETPQKAPECGPADAIDNGAEFRNRINPRTVG